MISNPFRYLSQLLARKDVNGNPLVQPFTPDEDVMTMSGTASGTYYRAMIEKYGEDSVYCGLTADGVDPMSKYVAFLVLYNIQTLTQLHV
jgi:hypothetical protein